MTSRIKKRSCLTRAIPAVVSSALVTMSATSWSAIPDVHIGGTDIHFAGFGTVMYAETVTADSEEQDFAGMSNEGEYTDFNNLGLRMDANLSDALSVTIQVLSEGSDDYKPVFDWLFATYEFTSEWSLALGKVRVPVFMYSDYLDTTYAYQWLEPPKVVYNAEQTPFKSIDGAKLAYTTEIGEWNSELLLFGGSSDDDFNQQGVDDDLELNNGMGFAWTMERDWLTLRAFYFSADATLDVLTNQTLHGLFYGATEGDDSTIALAMASLNPDPAAFPAALQAAGVIEGTEQMLAALLSKPGYKLDKVKDSILLDDDHGVFYGLGLGMDFGKYFIVSEVTQIDSDPNIVLPSLFSFYAMYGVRLTQDWTIALTYGHDKDRANEKVWESIDSYLIASPTTISQGQANALLKGVRDVLETQTKILQNYDVKNYTLSARWDFHKSAALKMEYLTQDFTINFDDKNSLKPEAYRIGIDFVF